MANENISTETTSTVPSGQPDQEKKKKSIWKKILLIIIIVILLLLCIRACGVGSHDPGGLELGVIDQNELDSEADRERLQQTLNQQVEAGMVSIFMNTEVTVDPDGEADWLIQNIEQNHFSLQIDIKEESSGTVIYSSPIVPPGYKIESDRVTKTLSSGSHACLAEFSIIDPETSETINRVGLNINVTY